MKNFIEERGKRMQYFCSGSFLVCIVAGLTAAGSCQAASRALSPELGGLQAPELLHQVQVQGPGAPVVSPPPDEPDEKNRPDKRGPESFSIAATKSIVTQLNQARVVCNAVDPAYRVDCLAKELKAIADSLSGEGDYAEAAEVLEKASQDLKDQTRGIIDNSKPRLRVTLPSSPQRAPRPPLAAILPENVEAVNEAAIGILDEATTVLLRSAEQSAERAAHYQQIAQALDSNKVLLRS